jgi:hypothetical protein
MRLLRAKTVNAERKGRLLEAQLSAAQAATTTGNATVLQEKATNAVGRKCLVNEQKNRLK